MRKIIFIILIAFCAILYGCSYTDKDRYMNFLADLDLISRFDACFDDMSELKPGLYTLGELEYIKQDINSFDYPYEEGRRANEYLYSSAQYLINAIEDYKNEDPYNYNQNITQAREYYAQANAQISAIRNGEENV